jgi:hypothetical protein
MRPLALWYAALTGFCALGCAAIFPSTEPGTPGGGKYCNRARAEDEPACYATEAQRAAAYHGAEYEAERPAREAAVANAAAQEAERRDAWQAEKEQKAAAEIAAREERERKTAEFVAERDRKDATKAAAALEVHNLALDKEYAGPAISAIMCSIDDEVRGLRADLAHEKRVTAVGGVVDLKARNDIASGLVDDSDALARYGTARVPCKDVAGVEACHQNLSNCDGRTHDIAQVWVAELGTLWGSNQTHPAR